MPAALDYCKIVHHSIRGVVEILREKCFTPDEWDLVGADVIDFLESDHTIERALTFARQRLAFHAERKRAQEHIADLTAPAPEKPE